MELYGPRCGAEPGLVEWGAKTGQQGEALLSWFCLEFTNSCQLPILNEHLPSWLEGQVEHLSLRDGTEFLVIQNTFWLILLSLSDLCRECEFSKVGTLRYLSTVPRKCQARFNRSHICSFIIQSRWAYFICRGCAGRGAEVIYKEFPASENRSSSEGDRQTWPKQIDYSGTWWAEMQLSHVRILLVRDPSPEGWVGKGPEIDQKHSICFLSQKEAPRGNRPVPTGEEEERKQKGVSSSARQPWQNFVRAPVCPGCSPWS